MRLVAIVLSTFWTGGFLLSVAVLPRPVYEGRWAVLEPNDEFLALVPVLLGDKVLACVPRRCQDEHPVLTLGRLDVAMLALGGFHQPKMHT